MYSDNIDRVELTEGETFLWIKVVENCANHETNTRDNDDYVVSTPC